MRKTLFRQLIIYMLIFGILLSAASYLVIEFFFDDYYYSEQGKSLANNTKLLTDEYNQSGLQGFQTFVSEHTEEYGISAYLMITESGTLYGTSTQGAGRQSIGNVFPTGSTDEVFISSSGGQSGANQWLSYLTETDDGNFILGRISYTGMDSVVGMVQQFFLFFGIALAVIFIIFAYIFSKSMSRPLNRLNAIAEKMGYLDFSMRYTGNRKDEIGNLGKTLNEITAKLENTINQLQGELSKEKTMEKMRTQFTAQVSHELQTPLSVIKGYSEALSDRIYSDTEASGVYEILLTETEKISNMVDDLLDLSQMDSGAYIIRRENFSLPQLVQKVYSRHKDLPSEKEFDLRLDIKCPMDTNYSGDSLRLEQAVRNILTNAIKYVKNNGIVSLKLYSTEGILHLDIFNQGDNIPDEDIQQIFNSYYQGKNNRGGTGLGLAITKHIIDLHSGLITVENKADGVLFQITLP